MTTYVSFPDIVASFKTALTEILTAYFDGQIHKVSNVDVVFPSASIVWDIRQLKRPIGLTIALIGNGIHGQKEYNTLGSGSSGDHGKTLIAEIVRTVVISCPISPGDSGKSRNDVDSAWGSLYALFCNKGLFSPRKIINPVLSAVPSDITDRLDIAEASGTFTCSIIVDYLAYNK